MVLTNTPSSSFIGEPVNLSATVAAVSPAMGTPAGDVSFYDGLTLIDTASLDGSGRVGHDELPDGGRPIAHCGHATSSTFNTSTSAL